MSLKAQTLRAHGYNFSCSSRTIKRFVKSRIKSIAIVLKLMEAKLKLMECSDQINRDLIVYFC